MPELLTRTTAGHRPEPTPELLEHTYPKGRRCPEPGCITRLSRYNGGLYCWCHAGRESGPDATQPLADAVVDTAELRVRVPGSNEPTWALIDASDEPALAGLPWKLNAGGYVIRSTRIKGKTTHLALARILAGLEKGNRLEVDHINGDKLDNRRCNLRVVTHAQNRQNTKAIGRLRGVNRHHTGKFRARVVIAGTEHHVGLFDTEAEAAEAISRYRARHAPFSDRDQRAA